LSNPTTAAEPIHTHRFASGLTLLVEPMRGVSSASMTLLLPAGAASEPADQRGVGDVLAEMMLRGAGELDARAHSDALDRLGVHRSSEVRTHHLRLGATMMGDRIAAALPLMLDCALRPQLTDEAFDPSRQLAIAAIDALDDDPQQKVMIELKSQHLGEPIGRSTLGRLDDLKNLTADQVRAFYQQRCKPGGAILALAGNVNFEKVRDQVGQLIESWTGSADEIKPNPLPPRVARHIEAATAQQHIALAYDTIGELDPASMTQRVAIGVLAGGMSGRLFTEVRENRGLCYAVGATYAAMREHGSVMAYAGTTTQRAPETLKVLKDELRKLSDGVEQDEFERAVVGLKARLVMQGESTGARAASLAGDQFVRGKVRTLDEVAAEIDAVSLDAVNAFVADHKPDEFTQLIIGPKEG